MDAGDDEIEAAEDFDRIIERAVGEDVGFNALENPKALSERPIEPVGFALLLFDFLEREAPGVVPRLRVVSDPEILKAAFARGQGHALQRLGAVRRVGMAMEDAVQILVGDKLRKLALER